MKILSSLVLASVLSLGAFGCAAQHDGDDAANTAQEVHTGPKSINATTEKRFEQLGGVWKVTGIDVTDEQPSMELSIIEYGGGDPALNGDYLYLSAYGPDHGDGGVFELGMNISQLTSATLVGNDSIKLVGTQDTFDQTSIDTVKNIPFEATIKLTLVDRDIQPTISVVTQGKPAESITKTTEEGKDFFTSIFAVQEKESKAGNLVRVFETGGGDPAMNGDQLVLNILSYPAEQTYDLGLNVNGITKFEVTDTQIFIAGEENYMDSRSEIRSRPYAYTITYAIGQDGAPAPAITMTRTQ